MSAASLVAAPNPGPVEPIVFTVEEAAAVLRVAVVTVRRLIRTGKLKSVRIGKRVLILRQDLMEFLEGLRG